MSDFREGITLDNIDKYKNQIIIHTMEGKT